MELRNNQNKSADFLLTTVVLLLSIFVTPSVILSKSLSITYFEHKIILHERLNNSNKCFIVTINYQADVICHFDENKLFMFQVLYYWNMHSKVLLSNPFTKSTKRLIYDMSILYVTAEQVNSCSLESALQRWPAVFFTSIK